MKLLRKYLRPLALCLLVVFFASASSTRSVAMGRYTTASMPTQYANMTDVAAIPALAIGAVVVGAFVVGFVNGYYDRQTAVEGSSEVPQVLSVSYDSSDFSSFDS